jgi:hypothetical protein
LLLTAKPPSPTQVSITFDPFMYLSLPLPARKRRFDVHVVPMRGPAALVRLVHSLPL